MVFSKNNIIVPMGQSKPSEYAILNPLSGSFDIMNENEYQRLVTFKENGTVDSNHSDFYQYLLERGYLVVDGEAEKRKIAQEFANFQKEIENSQVQLLLIPSYSCNLACTYCYEHSLPGKGRLITKEVVDAFFNYARLNFRAKKVKPFITLFGGEPFIDSPAHREIIQYIVDNCVAEGWELSAVSNGYDLASYVDLLSKVKIKEIQITLDGSKEVHDQRRGTKGGGGSFDRIMSGLEQAINYGFPINLRTVVDYENINDLVRLAEMLDQKGWLDLGPGRFKTQIGRNYELFDCYAKPEHLMAQVELWAEFSKLSQIHPILKKLHRPDFKGIRYLVDTGNLYMASFDTCPAAKTEWVFDLHGDIYGCTASCGRSEFKLGTFSPEVALNPERVSEWQNRNVLTIPECRDCQHNIICGGGCGVVAAHKNGKVLTPDCRPIQELIELGVDYYQAEIRKMSGPEIRSITGCVICGNELIYQSSASSFQCSICGRFFDSTAACIDGHYVCDDCHRGNILGTVAAICKQTEITDPVELADQLFSLPNLKMHGPEYHSIVPAVIVAAYQNNIGLKNSGQIEMALERGKAIKGGVCGTHGACGAAIGLGIAFSIIQQVTPMSRDLRGTANRLTAEALLAMSQYGGPRCCKREAILTLEVAKRLIPQFKEGDNYQYQCRQSKDNRDCIHRECPFFNEGNQSGSFTNLAVAN